MTIEPQVPVPPRRRTPDPLAESTAEERADVEEDRRRQQELDDGELGGEA
ncbi:hypothetical protein ACI797_11145 [Geodermatophilus sp. SYSU D00691]